MSEQDLAAIRAATLRYCRGVDRCDAELIASAFHPDAVDEHGTERYTGETVGPELVEMIRAAGVSMHHLTNQTIELHGDDRAGVESYFIAWQGFQREGHAGVVNAIGRYLDRFERRDGEWRIAHRVVVVEQTWLLPAAVDLGSGPRPTATKDRLDPSYAVLGA